ATVTSCPAAAIRSAIWRMTSCTPPTLGQYSAQQKTSFILHSVPTSDPAGIDRSDSFRPQQVRTGRRRFFEHQVPHATEEQFRITSGEKSEPASARRQWQSSPAPLPRRQRRPPAPANIDGSARRPMPPATGNRPPGAYAADRPEAG